MLLWLMFAALTAATVLALTEPFGRARHGGVGGSKAGEGEGAGNPLSPVPRASERPYPEPESPELAIYRGQIAEIASEREQGLIGAEQAQAARAEVGRRMLALRGADEARAPFAAGLDKGVRAANLMMRALLVVVPLLSVGLYAGLGHPGLPGRPAAGERAVAIAEAPLQNLLAKVEGRLREKPDDGEGWDVIAPVYMAMGRYGEAADAFSKAIRLNGDNAKRLNGFAKASILAGNGIVSEPARVAFEQLLASEPGAPEPRYWLSVAKEQDGRTAEAIADYRAMLVGAPRDAPWRQAVENRIAALTGAPPAGGPPAALALPATGGSPALTGLPPEQAQMIAGMVEGLAKRLALEPNDLQGWLRLIKSYQVLGRGGDARTALATARTTFASDTSALAQLSGLATSLGIGS